MRRLTLLLVCNLLIGLLCGCQNSTVKQKAMDVIVEGGKPFPDFLVGTWKADHGGWEFVFDPNGALSSAVIGLGRVRMRPGKVTTVPMQMGGKGVFKPGPWAVQYSYEQRQLIVDIKIDSFHAELGGGVVKGSAHDIFVGSISGDGRLWWAEHFSYPEYIADTKKYPNHKLTVERSDMPREGLLFQKVQQPK